MQEIHAEVPFRTLEIAKLQQDSYNVCRNKAFKVKIHTAIYQYYFAVIQSLIDAGVKYRITGCSFQ